MASIKGGYVDDFTKVAPENFLLYNPPGNGSSSGGTVTQSNPTPGLNNTQAKTGGANVNTELPNNFLYSMDGGCALCNKGGCGYNKGSKGRSGGDAAKKGGFGLEPFISALALLGARLLADKEVGLFNNKKSTTSNKSSRKSSKYQEQEEDDD